MEVISQSTTATIAKCPKCGKNIVISHEDNEKPNSGIGRLDNGEQLYTSIVCTNKKSGAYCPYAVEFVFNASEDHQ